MLDPRENEIEELARRWVDPMQILKDHQYWLRSSQTFELALQRRQGAFLFSLRGQIDRGKVLAAGQ